MTPTRSTAIALAASAAGVVLVVLAVIYFVEPAHALPSFLPGHVGTGSSEAGHHHVKHGVAALAVALAAFAYAWFATGPKAAARPAAGVDAGA
jgi:hypothetical protein